MLGQEARRTVPLPSSLDEISGLVWLNGDRLAALNDEKGNVYILDLSKEELVQEKIDFGKNADYEGLCIQDSHFYALESNGNISRFEQDGKNTKVFKRPDAWKGKEFEGICSDPENKRLLIARKNKDKKIKVYAFDLEKNKHIDEQLISIERTSQLKKFNCSGIALNEGHLFLISGPTAQILEYDLGMNKVIKVANLYSDKFVQIEGIAVKPNGELFIASEKARKKSAYLYYFKNW